jgi:hypothetical protein
MTGQRSLKEIREILQATAAAHPTFLQDDGDETIKALREFVEGVRKRKPKSKQQPAKPAKKKKAVRKTG